MADTTRPAEDAPQSETKAIIKNVDMSEEMQRKAVDIAADALVKFTVEKDVAAHVKRTMDKEFGPTWHAVVGKNYGSYVTHGEFERGGTERESIETSRGGMRFQ